MFIRASPLSARMSSVLWTIGWPMPLLQMFGEYCDKFRAFVTVTFLINVQEWCSIWLLSPKLYQRRNKKQGQRREEQEALQGMWRVGTEDWRLIEYLWRWDKNSNNPLKWRFLTMFYASTAADIQNVNKIAMLICFMVLQVVWQMKFCLQTLPSLLYISDKW